MEKVITFLQDYEKELIVSYILNEYKLSQNENAYSDDTIHLINANLHLTDNTNLAFKAHKDLIGGLINYYTHNNFSIEHNAEHFLLYTNENIKIEILKCLKLEDIPYIVEELHIRFLNSQFSYSQGQLNRAKSKHYLKEYGAVYTLKRITNEMVVKTVSNALKNTDLKDLKCLDFASGTGRFYFEAIKILRKKYSLELKDIVCKHLYAVDVDEVALNILKCKVISLFDNIDEDILLSISRNILHRNALIPNTSLLSNSNISFDFSKDFKEVFNIGGFSAIFSNPPYYLLKVNNKKSNVLNGYFTNLKSKIKSEIQFFKTSGVYNYSIEGMLNYYQLSIEMILKLTKENGEIGVICPSSIFADLTASRLRKFLLNNNTLRFIRYYREASNLFDNVAQSTVIFYLKKGGISDKIKIEHNDDKFRVALKTINKVFDKNQEIPLIDEVGWSILSKLSSHKKIKDYTFIRNKRGELDLTQYKDCILKGEKTDYRLVRGNMIKEDGLVDKNDEFVSIDDFVNRKSTDFIENDLNKSRLICQQISNVDLRKRLKFTFSEPRDILANSCNYINSLRSFDDLKKLHFLLNSELLNWRFKVTSSNNHINNYELDELPILNLEQLDLNSFNGNKYENEMQICKLYGLNESEINYILDKVPNIKLEEIKLLNEVI
ncbi:hypothetical protein BTO05_00840 [Winogradskyella sp. PC-19]|uniref:Eco57I restriction-modification methylase domain-containing protein n=1 Tax=Winogradskyella sp. PC-19 TaxID=754417 RepID=UPI000B3C6FE2|nr:Eco57I restriction-modification methylase domain-containing protein [Winogradskyella sp. PC-19]ARV08252.1 hypothetical protein BTO05_00840 [Winogradskyella sp. PC-19]